MHRDPKDSLEAWADRALKQLPERRAPAHFAPKVLAAIQKRRVLPWYRRPWLTWPRQFQVLSVGSLGTLGTGAVWAMGAARAAATPVVATVKNDASSVWNILNALSQALTLAAAQVPSYIWIGLVSVIAVAWLSCLALGTACWKLAQTSR
jgi:hypothetical protein